MRRRRGPADPPTDPPVDGGPATRSTASRVATARPVRVIGRYVGAKGPLLAAGLTYQALFALFAGLWVGFSVAGFVVSGDEALRDQLVVFIRTAVPGLIQDASGAGVVDPDALLDATVFGWTGAIALVGLLFSSITLFGGMRDSVRTIFRAPSPATPFLRLVLRDLGLALAFGAAVVLSATVSLLSTTAVRWALHLLDLSASSPASVLLLRATALVLVFLFDAVVLAALFRVLAGLHIPGRRLLAGSALGAAGFVGLTVVGGTLLRATGNNPLLASFAAVIGLLIVIDLLCQVLLLAAAWIAVGMDDIGVLADPHQEAERLRLLEEERLAQEARVASRSRRAVEAVRGLLTRLPRPSRRRGGGDGGRR
jgi:membrane protein